MDPDALRLDAAAIAAAIPHDEPFLFLDSATRGDEFFLRGHFRDNPVFPASIMLEALRQLAVLFLVAAPSPALAEKKADPAKIFFHSSEEVRCSRFCRPGDVLEMEIKVKRIRHPRGSFQGAISVGGERATYAEGINLMFDWQA